MSVIASDWSALLQQKVMATPNEDLQCLLRVANTPEERWRLVELLIILGARTAVQMLENNDVACSRATPGSQQHGRSPNSCAECSFQEVESLLGDAIICPDTPFAGHAEGHERVHSPTVCDFQADSKEDQKYVGCVGKSFTSSLRVIKSRKSRRNRPATASEASPSSAHRSSPGAWPQEARSTSAAADRKMSNFRFDNRFGHDDIQMPQQCGGRRALDYDRRAQCSFELHPLDQVTPASARRQQQSQPITARQWLPSTPSTARRAAPFSPASHLSPSHTGHSSRRSGQETGWLRHGDQDSAALRTARDRMPPAVEDARQNRANEHSGLTEVVFAHTARPSQAQASKRSTRDHCSGNLPSFELARQALLRCSGSGQLADAQAALEQGRPGRKLMGMLSLGKPAYQQRLIPSSNSEQPWSARESEISDALQGLGSIMMSTAASALQNPAELDHTDASKVDSSELVTVRAAPNRMLAPGQVDAS